MAKISRDYTNPLNVLKKIDAFTQHALDIVKSNPTIIYSTQMGGELNLTDESLGFDNREELREQLEGVNITDIHSFLLWIRIVSKKKDSYVENNELRIMASYRQDSKVVDVSVSENKPSILKEFMDELPVLLGAELRLYSADDDQADKLQAAISKATNILQSFPLYQTRLKESFKNEKDVQNFTYPILKSHFDDLIEEGYLPPVAGASSKPDFGIEAIGLAFELKYANGTKPYKKIAEEIATDLMRYFGATSPYNSLIVFIYDMAHQPIPANFVPDLERIPQIAKVIISPGVTP